ncbi:hypothetical protein AMTRI_Chr03g46740 [Amborella trichopoda]
MLGNMQVFCNTHLLIFCSIPICFPVEQSYTIQPNDGKMTSKPSSYNYPKDIKFIEILGTKTHWGRENLVERDSTKPI